MSSEAALAALRSNAGSVSLSAISDKSIQLGAESFPFDAKLTFTPASSEKFLSYSLISVFLLVQDPKISVIKYRQVCKKYNVEDSVKTLDKAAVLEYFKETVRSGGKHSQTPSAKESVEKDDRKSSKSSNRREKGRDRDRHEHRKDKSHHKSSSSRKREDDGKSSSSGSAKKKVKESTPLTSQQILDNLKTVVDKRVDRATATGDRNNVSAADSSMAMDVDDGTRAGAGGVTDAGIDGAEEPPALLSQEEEEKKAIRDCLSAKGYEARAPFLSQDDLEKDRLEVEKIMAYEIPVGNSASILRCGVASTNNTSKRKDGTSSSSSSAPNSRSERNFARVLELYNQSLKEKKRPQSSSRPGSAMKKLPRPAGRPIIIVPNAMTSPISLINAQSFFGKAVFLPRDVAMKQLNGPKPTSLIIKRNISPRLGGGSVEYEIIDNPSRKLQSSKDWDRVVAVLAQGAAWQFKGWKMSNPVDVFSKSFGYYIGFEGAPVPKEVQSWNVKRECLSRDKRGVDSVVHASFWNGLDEWMGIHKRGYLPGER